MLSSKGLANADLDATSSMCRAARSVNCRRDPRVGGDGGPPVESLNRLLSLDDDSSLLRPPKAIGG